MDPKNVYGANNSTGMSRGSGCGSEKGSKDFEKTYNVGVVTIPASREATMSIIWQFSFPG